MAGRTAAATRNDVASFEIIGVILAALPLRNVLRVFVKSIKEPDKAKNTTSCLGFSAFAGRLTPILGLSRRAHGDPRRSDAIVPYKTKVNAPQFALIAEQKSEVIQREGAGEVFFAQDVCGQRALAALELADFLLDALLNQQPVGDDMAGLADTVGAVDGLVFDRRIPPWIVEHDVTRGGEV